MLETPKETTALITEQSVVLGNQQATALIAGLFLGEGHFSLQRQAKKGDRVAFRTEIGFTNQDPALIDTMCQWLDENGIAHFIHDCSGDCYQIHIQRHGPLVKLVNILEPFLIGTKLHEARILRRFILRRMEKAGGNEARRYDAEDHADFEQRLSVRESPETTRAPECWNKHQHLKI